MDAMLFLVGGLVIGIAHFKMELLIRGESFKVILGISVVLFLACPALILAGVCRSLPCGALLSPLISLGLFRLCRKIFLSRVKREPVDTFLDWRAGLAADRIFNVVFFVSASWLWILTALAAKLLAKLG
jgi:hypothetical protein